tara:strand:- start:17997 stop:19736 length:1740 start_codon:yes stop_codon:yes gene_type:complete
MQYFVKILSLLSETGKKEALILLLFIFITALLEIVGVVSVVPFVAVLTNPIIVEENNILNNIFLSLKIFGVEDVNQFMFILGILVLFLLVTSLTSKAFLLYYQVKFVQMQMARLSSRLVKGYLSQPFVWFLNRDTAEFGINILAEVQEVISEAVKPTIELIAKGTVVFFFIILLFIADPMIIMFVIAVIGGGYLFTYLIIKNYLNNIGIKRLKNNSIRFEAVLEAFNAIKEVKFKGLEQKYIDRFSFAAENFAMSQAAKTAVSQVPRYAIEAIAFGGSIVLILFLMSDFESISSTLPLISLYIFAGYRLMPALQQIYVSYSSITYSMPALEKLISNIKNLKTDQIIYDQKILPLKKTINLKNINFRYPNQSKNVLENFNFSINAKSTIGVMGQTGCGKSTIIDIIIGLLHAQNGSLEIDNQLITKDNLRGWQQSIGYVPQKVYLKNDTISSNVAFGVESKNIDQTKVENACKIANLHNFITNQLTEQYQHKIGERGAKLSGGQGQRIGIARALYNDPDLLILDEATSALDLGIESSIIESIYKLQKKTTILIISHRLETLKYCDKIFLMENGNLKKLDI